MTTRRSTIVAAIPLSLHGTVMTTGEAGASGPRPAAPTPAFAERSQTRSSVGTIALPPTKPTFADVPDAHAVADPPAEPAPAGVSEVKSAERYVARAPVVKKRVIRTVHHRNSSGAYAQYGGRGWWGLGMGSSYRL
jgi:hypothetical protein